MKVVVKNLEDYPYRINDQQTKTDMKKRSAMCQEFSKKINSHEKFLHDVWFSNEAHFS